MRHISRLTLLVVSGAIAVAIAACGTVYQPPAENSVYIGVTTVQNTISDIGSRLSYSSYQIDGFLQYLLYSTWEGSVTASGSVNSDRNGRYYLLNAEVPGHWFWNYENGVCAGHGDSADFYKGNIWDLVCTVYISSAYAYGYSTDGSPVYTGGGDKVVANANQNLYPGDCRTSAEGMTQLCYQGDGNLVLYDNGPAVWASNTAGTSANTAVMQGDGNFVVYDADWIPVWSSGTAGHSGAFVSVQNDGCALIYESDGNSVIWGTGTCRG